MEDCEKQGVRHEAEWLANNVAAILRSNFTLVDIMTILLNFVIWF